VPAKDLKSMADEMMQKHHPDVIALVGVNEGKAANVVSLSAQAVASGLDARELVKAGVFVLGGKGGGGREDMAQGGGPNAAKAEDALKAIEAAVAGAK
jgi:alanyl-tRNA synthetase